VSGLSFSQGVEPPITPVGQLIDRHEHFMYVDQSGDLARELMEDLNLDRLPLVDRELRVVGMLKRT